MHLCHPIVSQGYGIFLYPELEVHYALSQSSLFVAGICMPISCLWLEVHYVLSWPAKKVHHIATRLLPICCRCNYANFASQSLNYQSSFILYFQLVRCNMYYHGRPNILYKLRRSLHAILEYISRQVKASANIFIIDYAEAFVFRYISACLSFSIFHLSLLSLLFFAHLPTLAVIYTGAHTSVRVVFCQYFI